MKELLILERSQSVLESSNDETGAIYLEGVFTEIGVKNDNERIYEESEVLPHILELQEYAKKSKLLGELDHPKDFDISLSNTSHVIENLYYDKDKKQVIGKIRLLNTSKGKEAQALVKDGIPLHISSRAAGSVDEKGKVKIKKFFTYDLVARPGFANAELSRVNESLGFANSENLFIYEMDSIRREYKNENKKENKNDMAGQFITVEDFNKYSEYIKTTLEGLKESRSSVTKNDSFDKLVAYTETIAEKVNQLTDYANYVAENADKGIEFSNYLAENLNKIKEFTNYIAEELDNSVQYSEHIAEQSDKGIQFANYLAEKLDNGLEFSNYLAENIDKGLKYSNYLAEKLDNGLEFSNYLAEKVDNSIEYTEHLAEELDTSIQYAEHVAEKTDNVISFSNYLSEGLESTIKYGEYIAETVNTNHGLKPLNEKLESIITESAESNDSYKNSITEQLAGIIKLASEQSKIKTAKEYNFVNLLSENKLHEFNSLPSDKQARVVESMNKTIVMSTAQAESILNKCISESSKPFNVFENIPEKYKAKWDLLGVERKQQIISESKLYGSSLNTAYGINNFWATRDLRSQQVNVEKLNESKTAAELNNNSIQQSSMTNDAKQALINKVKFNLGRH